MLRGCPTCDEQKRAEREHRERDAEPGTRAEDVVGVSTQVLKSDEKRLHLYHVLTRSSDGTVLAEAEHLCLHVDKRTGHVAPAEAPVLRRIAKVATAHSHLPRPERAGRRIGDPRA